MPRPDPPAEGRSFDVVAVGHAIVDVVAPCEDHVVSRFGLDKGTMTLVDHARSEDLYASLGATTEASGGSAANTAAGLASLGAAAAFVGKVRDDHLGDVFARDIRAAGVTYDVAPGVEGPGTGRCMVMVTSDAEKTMCTSLGIGDFLHPDDIDADLVARSRMLYLEGYLCGLESTDATVEAAVGAAEAAGTLVSLSLSDPLWVSLHGDALAALLPRVDVLFANDVEACGLVGADHVEDAVAELATRCDTVAVTCGADGSIVARDGRVVRIAAEAVPEVVDTTGAGDLYAAGFLYGRVRGGDIEHCGRLGGLAASHILGHYGARPRRQLAGLLATG